MSDKDEPNYTPGQEAALARFAQILADVIKREVDGHLSHINQKIPEQLGCYVCDRHIS